MRSPARLGQAEHQVEVLHGLRGGALPEVVDRARARAPCRCARRRRRTAGRSWSRSTSRVPGGRVDDLDERLVARRRRRTARAAPPAATGARRRHVAAGQLALVERHEVRLELDPQLGLGGIEQRQLLLDLGRVPVGGDLVGEDVLAGHRQVRGLVERAPGARDALLGVDHHVGDQPGAGERRERRAATPSGSSPGWRRSPAPAIALAVQLGQPVDGLARAARAAGARRTSARRSPASAGGSRR